MKNTINFHFIILHYKSLDDTIKCVDSINRLKLDENMIVHILIIDNGSNNGTGEILERKYRGINNVEIKILENNLGFSNGNNFGYCYSKKSNLDFMIVCNNDIIFKQKDFLERVYLKYLDTDFDLLGPDIYIPEVKYHSNPLALKGMTIDEAKTEYKKKIKELEHLKFSCFHDRLTEIKIRIIILLKRLINYEKKYDVEQKDLNDVVLQGACYILSKNFLDKQDILFFPKESFYYEEFFLYRDCKMKKLKILFSPSIKVIHNESASTKKTLKNRQKIKTFKLKNSIKSLKLYIDTFKSN